MPDVRSTIQLADATGEKRDDKYVSLAFTEVMVVATFVWGDA